MDYKYKCWIRKSKRYSFLLFSKYRIVYAGQNKKKMKNFPRWLTKILLKILTCGDAVVKHKSKLKCSSLYIALVNLLWKQISHDHCLFRAL